MDKVNLLNLDESDLQVFLQSLGEPAYRAKQILQWVHQYGVSIDEMTNLSKSLRQKLQESACIVAPEIAHEHTSLDGTWKVLLKVGPNSFIETVFIPEDDRGTLCISSQVGCALNCTFCSTATQGFSRNLSVAEIIGQLWVAVRRLSKLNGRHDRQITNVVMMGMGEPLLNYENVVKAMHLMRHDFAYGLSKRRVTLSTSGVVPMMYQLAKDCDVALAVSLHAPNDALRDELVPINKKYPLQVLMQACKNYFAQDPRRRVTFEYVMLKGVNDTPAHARQLITLLQGVPAKVNLIPFNPFPNTTYERSDLETILRFQAIVHKSGVVTTVRKTRGDDIDAACGQLVGDFVDKTKRRERLAKKIVIIEENR